MAERLFKPRRSTSNFFRTRPKYSKAFTDCQETECYQNSRAGRILSNIEQYYFGKRKAKKLRDARREAGIDVEEIFSKSDDEYCFGKHDTNSEFDESDCDKMDAYCADGAQVAEK